MFPFIFLCTKIALRKGVKMVSPLLLKKKNLKVTMKVRNKTKQIKTSNNKWNTRIYDTWPFLHPPITFLYIYEG